MSDAAEPSGDEIDAVLCDPQRLAERRHEDHLAYMPCRGHKAERRRCIVKREGANWQRRGLKMPVVVPIKEQLPKRPPR